MAGYTLSNTKLVYERMESHEPDRSGKLLAWVQAVCRDPEVVTTGSIVPQHRQKRRPVYFSDVPGAETRVAFIVADVPARSVHLLSIDDDSYGLPLE